MSAQNKTTLKSYFQTGNAPTEAQFVHLIDSPLNRTDGGIVSGDTTFNGNTTINGIDLTPNDIGTTLLGLNPTWIQNFGGATLAAGDHTTDTHMLDVLTPTNTLLRMALALKKVASQGTVVTAAQAGQIFGLTSTNGALIPMTGVTDVTTNFIPANLKVNTISGTTAANLTLNDSATDLASDQDMSMILFNDYIIEAGHVVKICTHTNNEHKASACEFVVSGAGTDVMDRMSATTDGHQDIILTASAADTTILAGSYIYLNAGADSDELTIKGCFRTTGGTIAVTYAA
tara:strand:+ start:874 stop:1737 length:864 start_codon:yes stop_codon:yes gene_type:complete